ncbi:uncharacterized protein LY89DRAFT_672685 [Mollisia scopiformis]|uniref:Uncharacterized protein n=1 Tax=Mollisia scopiformis TaxID=149040 RepID=A0A194WZV4_MOLSC|nr:uncharacterized protein LY89DRAFT_672685 [Mollisia scopiformis]KUJ13476.1 hypothetical protein LY89DRAFT_672685 [Mollisia scopiformis]
MLGIIIPILHPPRSLQLRNHPLSPRIRDRKLLAIQPPLPFQRPQFPATSSLEPFRGLVLNDTGPGMEFLVRFMLSPYLCVRSLVCGFEDIFTKDDVGGYGGYFAAQTFDAVLTWGEEQEVGDVVALGEFDGFGGEGTGSEGRVAVRLGEELGYVYHGLSESAN